MTELLDRISASIGGRYVLEGEIGRGGMATVYLARDLRDERRVAIKVMDPELSAAVGSQRFKREIEVVSRLQHPHILGILDSGEAAGTSYYVMPYVSGETLRARLTREKQLPIEDAIRIAREVADALDFAHRQGVVHRDIKPENILLEHGRVLVADFGIARAASAEGVTQLTKTGTAMGTPHYMSPEQIFGEKDIDGRTDQYALGCMLHEMLAGQPPFVGPHAQSLMAQHALDEPPLVTRFRPTTPPNVEDAIYTALAKARADRFPTLDDFHRALENSGYTSMMKITRLQRATQAAMLAMPQPKTPVWKRAVAGVAALALLTGAGAGAWTWYNGNRGALTSPDEIAAAKKIAVLYFRADPSLAPVADGLTEALIERLREVNVLDVRSASGVAPFRGTKLASDSIGRLLDVGRLVQGDVREDGDRFVVAVRLVDARSGATIDELSVTQPRGELFAARDKVAEEVAAVLRRQLGDDVQLKEQRATTGNQEAWLSFQRAERTRKDAEATYAAGEADRARSQLQSADSLALHAASLDAAWSAPHALRSALAILQAEWAPGRNPEVAGRWLDSAAAFADSALSRDPRDAEAREMRGTARYTKSRIAGVKDIAQNKALVALAEADLDTVTQIAPSRASAFSMWSRVKYATGDVTGARYLATKALEKDAFLTNAAAVRFRIFITSYDQGDWIEARRACAQGQRQYPDDPQFVRCQLVLLIAPDSVVSPERAWGLLAEYEKRVPKPQWPFMSRYATTFIAGALGRAGLRDSAHRVLERNRADATIDPTGDLVGYEALARAHFGDKETAIRLLQRYVAEHPEHRAGFTGARGWWWEPLRSDPRWSSIATMTR